MLNKIRIVVFRGLVTPGSAYFDASSVKSPHQDVPWASRAINRLCASIKVHQTEQRKQLRLVLGETAVARLAVLGRDSSEHETGARPSHGCWP